MSLPFFYVEGPLPESEIQLDEQNSRHAISVLRMTAGEELQVTDGKGNLQTAVIIDPHKKKAVVRVLSSVFTPLPANRVTIGISLLKNVSRLEWFLEKAVEIGVGNIVLLQCQRTEKQHIRIDRLQQILISAMLQSQQVWLTRLLGPVKFDAHVASAGHDRKYIAHCLDTPKIALRELAASTGEQLLLIGPEGDFSQEEADLAIRHNFIPVKLGETRLRTETAGMVGATLLCVH
ncbi:RsmE family RNA methyltransferase [Flavihumibacter petaseus]|uniref:Ribosomal RNA small subunit methyltransferase E n=1 Tax=Flavihumibacter petaseus NBRC 106054 TaxID=1220578 RepID=A0A0E9N5C0_9BACT|nr:RsmE family RNA methyltransferase [Flavihumibacter petaseus]GAO45003.1 putative RNA methyltransferase [Flavihumibacter petaseus NBRC 106054]